MKCVAYFKIYLSLAQADKKGKLYNFLNDDVYSILLVFFTFKIVILFLLMLRKWYKLKIKKTMKCIDIEA